MFHFDDLCAQFEFPALTGSQVDELRWNLRRQAKRIRCSRTMRDHSLRARCRDALDHFFGGGRPRSKTRFDGPDVNTPIERQ